MSECWLLPNWRPVVAAMVLPAVLLVGGVGWALVASDPWLRTGGVLVAMLSLAILGALATLLKPRLARDGDSLLVRLAFGPAERVPLDKVEVFFFGQGPAMAGPHAEQLDEDDQAQTGNVVVRLAESATELHRRTVDRRLGHWCDGYIVIRGTYCQPLNKEVMTELNQRLVACHRQQRAAQKKAGEAPPEKDSTSGVATQ